MDGCCLGAGSSDCDRGRLPLIAGGEEVLSTDDATGELFAGAGAGVGIGAVEE